MTGALEGSLGGSSLDQHALVNLLSHSFSAFAVATDPTTGASPSESRQATESLQHLQRAGVCGRGGLQTMRDLHPVIAWEHMMPDQFCKFYRFAFHLCKEPSRKHVLVWPSAWSLIMAGRFRLLDKWLDFVRSRKRTMQVINEDQWRQLLDFSRSVYEDLSNFDPNGAWACCLDEFVDHMRHTRSCVWDKATDSLLGFNGMDYLSSLYMAPVSPHCGSKRRPPDPIPVDPVCEQLNSIHLPHSPSNKQSVPAPPAPLPALTPAKPPPPNACAWIPSNSHPSASSSTPPPTTTPVPTAISQSTPRGQPCEQSVPTQPNPTPSELRAVGPSTQTAAARSSVPCTTACSHN